MAAKRGRPSKASMEVLAPAELTRMARVRPPEQMSAFAREIWLDIVNSLPAEHFRESDGLLLQRYCEVAVSIPDAKDSDEFAKLTRLQIALARALRLCPSSRTDPKTVGRQKSQSGRAWESFIDE